jgi:heme/copper-type cytochrome/quinol oxidase subunit 3
MENKTMMKLIVGTEAMFFLSLIMSFVYMAYNAGFEAHEVKALHIKSAGIFTIILLSSSFTFWLAHNNYKKGNIRFLKLWLIVTMLLGAVFLVGQGREYYHLICKNITLSGSVFGTSFFTLTGFHSLHVFIGLVILSIMIVLAFLGDFNTGCTSLLSTVGIYWHFVDVVWIVVFTVVYLLPLFKLI